ncbi:uncharacterized protein LOC126986169 isoform X2 [Eriocheir sinensis]|uniref:uncharacterized protein LOC126986169 isoform X2 n=1 Tax=Eriocheir sinensis TaxID=95602 RepID=UPI0021C5FE99|nr:uncharacterized protein LOC126986169 isoform X2 [Eriocheir sinensis]
MMVRCGGFCCCYCCSCRRWRGGYCFGSPPPPPPPPSSAPLHHHRHPTRTHLSSGGRWSSRLSGLLHALHAPTHAHAHAPATPPVTYCAAASQEAPRSPVTSSPPPRARAPASHEPPLPPAAPCPGERVTHPQAPEEVGGAAAQQQQQVAGRAYQGLGRRLRRALLRWGEDHQQEQQQQQAEDRHQQQQPEGAEASPYPSGVAVVQAAGQQAAASFGQRGGAGGGAAQVAAARRGSAGSVLSEGGAGRGVVASTLTRWRRLQGSVGSLTATFRQRASQRLVSTPSPQPAAPVTPATPAPLDRESPPPPVPADAPEDAAAPSGGASPVCTSPSTSSGTTSSDEAGDSSTGTVIFRPPAGHGAARGASPTLASSPTPPASPEGPHQIPQAEEPDMAAVAGREGPRRRASDALLALDGEPQPKRPTLAAGEAGPSPPLPACPPPSRTTPSPHTSPLQSPVPLSRRRFYESMMGGDEPPVPAEAPADSVSLSSDGDSGIVHEEAARHGGDGDAAAGSGDPRHTDHSESESDGGGGGTSESDGGEGGTSESERGGESRADPCGSEVAMRGTSESESGGRGVSESESERSASGGERDRREGDSSDGDVSAGRREVDDALVRTSAGRGDGEAATAAPPPTGEEEEDPGGGRREEEEEKEGSEEEWGERQIIPERVSQGQAAGNEVSAGDNLRGDTTTTTTATTYSSVAADTRPAEDTAGIVSVASIAGRVGMAPGMPHTLPPQAQLQEPPLQEPLHPPTSDFLHPSITSEQEEEDAEGEEEEVFHEERVMYNGIEQYEEDVSSTAHTMESSERDVTSEDREDTSATSESSERSEPEPRRPASPPTPAEHPLVTGAEGATTEPCDSDDIDSEHDSLRASGNDSDRDIDAEEEEDEDEEERLPVENDLESTRILSDDESSDMGIPVQPFQATKEEEEEEDREVEERDIAQTDRATERNARGSFDRRVCSDTQEEEESVEVTLSSAGPRILITVARGDSEGEGATGTPNHLQESGSATSGWGGCSLEGVGFSSTHLDSSHSGGPHLTHPRAPTPKSPITVDEWVAALPPHPSSVEEEGDAWGAAEGEDPGEDSLNLGAEAGLMCGSVGVSSTASAPASTTHTLKTTSATASHPEVRRSSHPENMLLAAAAVRPIPGRQRSHSLLSTRTDASGAVSTRPLTLSDVANIQQQQQRMGVEGRRSQFAALRDKQSSFQSELSGLSLHSRSSIDSLLDSRQADPVEVLLNLGFGGQPQDSLARIPERFLKPSEVRGNSIEDFLKSEEEMSEMMETAEMMPGLDPQALRRSSTATVSPLMTQLIENIREKQRAARHVQRMNSQESIPQPQGKLTGQKRFAQVAKKMGMQSVVANTLIAGAMRPNRHSSVLNPENRRLLDLQGQRSPEVPRKRLIIGQDSFDLDRDGQLMNEDEEWEATQHGTSPNPSMDDSAGEEKDVEEDISEDASEGGEGASDPGGWRHGPLTHKDSVWSMASSATSVDSNEEELRDQRRRLQLSLTRRVSSDSQEAPSTPAESLDSSLMTGSSADSAERRRGLLKRLGSSSKRISTSSSREVDELIPEEGEEGGMEGALQEVIRMSASPSSSFSSPAVLSAPPASTLPAGGDAGDGGVSVPSHPPLLRPHPHHHYHLHHHHHHHHPQHALLETSPRLPHLQSAMVRTLESLGHPTAPHPHTHPTTLPHTPQYPSPLLNSVRGHLDGFQLSLFSPTSSTPPSNTPVQRVGMGLRRQQRVEEGGLGVGSSAAPSHPPHHHPATTLGEQEDHHREGGIGGGGGGGGGRPSGGGGSDRGGGGLCRSSSAQSDSSGFMEGDAGEADGRTGPSTHPPSTTTTAITTTSTSTSHANSQRQSLLNTLQRYQHQLAEQERLSNHLHRLALDTALHPANHHHLVLHQLRSVRAIRTAIRAEVIHMENLLAQGRPDSFGHACLSNVVAQMMVLLQQQSELCQDLEMLTLVTPESPETPSTPQDGHAPPWLSPSHPSTPTHTHSDTTLNFTRPSSVTSHPAPLTPFTHHPTPPDSLIHPTPLTPLSQPIEGENMTSTPSTFHPTSRTAHSASPITPLAPRILPNASHTPPCTPSSPPPSSYSSLDVNWSLRRSPMSLRDERRGVGEEKGGERRSQSVPLSSSTVFNHPEVALLVQNEVQNRTSGLHQQLLQQTQDVADIKGMLQALLSRLK